MYENRRSGYHLLKNKTAICKRRTLVYQVLAAKERGFCRTGKFFSPVVAGLPLRYHPIRGFTGRNCLRRAQQGNELFFVWGELPNLVGVGKGLLGAALSVRKEQGPVRGVFLFKEELNGCPADAGDFPQGDRVGRSLAGFVVGVGARFYVRRPQCSAESTLPAGGPAAGAPLRSYLCRQNFSPWKPTLTSPFFRRRLPAAFSSSMPCFAGNNRSTQRTLSKRNMYYIIASTKKPALRHNLRFIVNYLHESARSPPRGKFHFPH